MYFIGHALQKTRKWKSENTKCLPHTNVSFAYGYNGNEPEINQNCCVICHFSQLFISRENVVNYCCEVQSRSLLLTRTGTELTFWTSVVDWNYCLNWSNSIGINANVTILIVTRSSQCQLQLCTRTNTPIIMWSKAERWVGFQKIACSLSILASNWWLQCCYSNQNKHILK